SAARRSRRLSAGSASSSSRFATWRPWRATPSAKLSARPRRPRTRASPPTGRGPSPTGLRPTSPGSEAYGLPRLGIADRRVASDNLSVEPRADLSEPQGPDEALRESEERFRGAFYYSPIGMGIVDMEGRFVRVNPALCRIGGYEEQELLGLTF